MNFLKKKVKNYIIVREGVYGLETFMDKEIIQFSIPHKRQLVSFLVNIINMLKESARDEIYDNRYPDRQKPGRR